MVKKGRGTLAKKLAKAEAKLQAAEDCVVATRIAGEQAIQRARMKSEKRIAEAQDERARRADKVARLQRTQHREDAASNGTHVSTPEEAALLVERRERAHEIQAESRILTPE